MPRVSVILPTYNDLDYLKLAIDSALNQTYSDFELIIVNDGSTDGTKEYLDQLQHDKLKVVHKENGGCFDALNTGLDNSSGELISWISSDNISTNYFVEALVAALDSCAEAKLAYAAYYNINADGKIINTNQNNHQLAQELVTTTHRGNAAFMYYRNCHDKVGPYIDSYSCDTDMWLKLSTYYKTVYIMEPLYFYRMHDQRATSKLDENYYLKTTEQILAEYREMVGDSSLLQALYGYGQLSTNDPAYFLAANDLAARFAVKKHLNVAMSFWKVATLAAPAETIKLVVHNLAQATATFPDKSDKIQGFFSANIKKNPSIDNKTSARYIKRLSELSKDAKEDGASDYIGDQRWLNKQNARRLNYFSFLAWKNDQIKESTSLALTSTP